MTPTDARPGELDPALDPRTWDLDVPSGLTDRVAAGVEATRRRRRRGLAVGGAAVATAVVAAGAWGLVRAPGPTAGPSTAAAPSTAAGPGVDLDGWTFTPPAGCRALDSESSSTVSFGPAGLDSTGVAPTADEMRVRLSGYSYECAGSILSVTRIDPRPGADRPGPSPLRAGASRAEVVRVVAAITVDPTRPDADPAMLRTRVSTEGNAVRAVVPDPAWGVLAVHVAGGDPARIDPLVASLRPTG